MLCAYLAAGVLVGLLLNTAFGIWWADPVDRARDRRACDPRRPRDMARPGVLRTHTTRSRE